jgi:hypothetical protein
MDLGLVAQALLPIFLGLSRIFGAQAHACEYQTHWAALDTRPGANGLMA